MKKIKLEPFEIQLAADVATRRFVENQKMGRTFGHGYKGSIDKTIALGVSGAIVEPNGLNILNFISSLINHLNFVNLQLV